MIGPTSAAAGSRHIEVPPDPEKPEKVNRNRPNGEIKLMPMLAMAAGVIAAGCFMGNMEEYARPSVIAIATWISGTSLGTWAVAAMFVVIWRRP